MNILLFFIYGQGLEKILDVALWAFPMYIPPRLVEGDWLG